VEEGNNPQITDRRRHPARRPLAPALTARRLVEVLGPDGAREWWRDLGVELGVGPSRAELVDLAVCVSRVPVLATTSPREAEAITTRVVGFIVGLLR
jgi:uncharacterized linocin/CFP29 family protein